MPKYIWHELPCGAMHRFKQYTFEDFFTTTEIYKLKKADRDKIIDPSTTGRKRALTARRISAKLIRMFWARVVDRLMESDRLVIDPYTSMYIGVERMYNPKKHRRPKKVVISDYIYGIVLNGFFHDYFFRMPARRRAELYERLRQGQSFIT